MQESLRRSTREAEAARVDLEETLRFSFQDLQGRLTEPGEIAALRDLAAEAWEHFRKGPAPVAPAGRVDLARTYLALARVFSASQEPEQSIDLCGRALDLLGSGDTDTTAKNDTAKVLRVEIGLESAAAAFALDRSGRSAPALAPAVAALAGLVPSEDGDRKAAASFAALCRHAAELALQSGDPATAEAAASLEAEVWNRIRDRSAVLTGIPDFSVEYHARALAFLGSIREQRGDARAAETCLRAIILLERSLLTAAPAADAAPFPAAWAEILCDARATLAKTLELSQPRAAAAAWREAAAAAGTQPLPFPDLRGKQARALGEAGRLLASLGESGEARAAYLEASRILLAAQRLGHAPPGQREFLQEIEARLRSLPESGDETES
ncbi:MAG TPA: hypothetical protein VMN36_16560 [Verrucomicrobiales bacterium]|nr:hypothetical protein [Verrucomicrobiales bacterium]